MRRLLFFPLCILIMGSCSVQRYYIVRHAEKAMIEANLGNDLPLTARGLAQAQHLAELLQGKQLQQIFSTNTIRTRSTAEPTAQATGLTIFLYGPRPDSLFMSQLKALKGNVLVVGHSNTVDDVVNGLMGKQLMTDLPDSVYGRLYIVTRKAGKLTFSEKSF